MESKKRRMLDPRVIRGKETERGKEEKVQLEKRGFESEFLFDMQQGCNEFVLVLIGVYFSPHVE